MPRASLLKFDPQLIFRVGWAALFLWAVPHSPTEAAEIVASWTSIQQVKSRPGSFRVETSVRLALLGGKEIQEFSGSTDERGQRRSSNQRGQLRAALPAATGNISWRVQGPRTVVRTWNAAQHVMTLRVTKTSESSCVASISNRLKPGFREYQLPRISNGTPTYLSSLRTENVTCRIVN